MGRGPINPSSFAAREPRKVLARHPAWRTVAIADQRARLVDGLRLRSYLTDKRVTAALLRVPREEFVRPEDRSRAYVDAPMDIGEGQTISAPHMVAIMAEALRLAPGQRVLEIGGGCGYHAAVVGELVRPGGHVDSVERIPALAARARENLRRAGASDVVTVHVGDGSVGLAGQFPYERIFVACAAPDVPRPLLEQLADGGLLLVPVGPGSQELVRVTRRGKEFVREDLGGCVFVPLIGAAGFPPRDAA